MVKCRHRINGVNTIMLRQEMRRAQKARTEYTIGKRVLRSVNSLPAVEVGTVLSTVVNRTVQLIMLSEGGSAG